MTNPTETSVVTSETLRWSLPSKYRGVKVSIALYPLIAKAMAKDIAMLQNVCASRRNQLLNAHASHGRGSFGEGLAGVGLSCSNVVLAVDFSPGSRPPAMLKSEEIEEEDRILPGLVFRQN
jgi:hypothetical protein